MTTPVRAGEVDDAWLELPGAPRIPGLRFRRFRGEEDYPAMVRVAQASRDADGVEETLTVDGLASQYRHLTNSDPVRDVLIAEIDGDVVAYGRVEWVDISWGGRSYDSFCLMHPAHRRRGIGRAMLHANEVRLREIAATHDAVDPSWLGSFGWDTDAGNRALLENEGYVVVRHFYDMLRPDLEDIDRPPLPPGVELRPASEQDFRRIFEADVEAFRDHFGAVDGSEEALRRWTSDPTFDPSLLVIAWDGDEVAGGVWNRIDTVDNERKGYQRGWLDSVFTRRPWRRRGLARALIGESLALLRERGMAQAMLGVDAENPQSALQLYSSAGFRVKLSSAAYRKPLR
jgi:mycothiol synthase